MRESLQFQFEDGALISKLYEAIGKASVNFPPLPRTATGSVGKGRDFKYAPYHKVVQCIKTPLAEQGVNFIQVLHNEGEDKASLTLVVSGHGAAIESTLTFKQDTEIKDFGADITYHKRYQLTSFFCLEGDPDADDFEDGVVERKTLSIEKKTESKSAENDKADVVAAKQETKKVDVSVAETAKSVAKVDDRTAQEKLTDAMKQLVWKMSDFDNFCKQHPEEFPDFHGASRLPPYKMHRLYELLVLHKGVTPF